MSVGKIICSGLLSSNGVIGQPPTPKPIPIPLQHFARQRQHLNYFLVMYFSCFGIDFLANRKSHASFPIIACASRKP